MTEDKTPLAPLSIDPQIIKLTVKSWRNTDKYPCPSCGQKLGMPTYTCTSCNIKIKPVINF